MAKKVAAVTVFLGTTAAALVATIFVATRTADLSAPTDEIARQGIELYFRPPLQYNKWAVNVAWVTLLWVGWLFVLLSTVVMWMSSVRDEKFGPGPIEKTNLGEKIRQVSDAAARRFSLTGQPGDTPATMTAREREKDGLAV